MRRTFKLLLGTWSARLDALIGWFERRTCQHAFRAAIIKDNPGKICRKCDTSFELTREEFYAEFGERYQAMLKN